MYITLFIGSSEKREKIDLINTDVLFNSINYLIFRTTS